MTTPVGDGLDILEATEEVKKLTSEMASSMNEMSTKDEQKFVRDIQFRPESSLTTSGLAVPILG